MLQHNPLYLLSLYTTISFGSQFPPDFLSCFLSSDCHIVSHLSLICLSRDIHLSGDATALLQVLPDDQIGDYDTPEVCCIGTDSGLDVPIVCR